MRFRFTTRRLLVATLLVAPVLAFVGSRQRDTWRREQFSKQELASIAAFCDRLDFLPEELGSWTLVKSNVRKTPRATRFQMVYRDSVSSREIEVAVFGGSPKSPRINLLARPSNPFTASSFEGWIHKESRTETLKIDTVGPMATMCHDSFARTLNKTQQNMQAFCHDGEWLANLPNASQTPYCGVNLKIQPDLNSWSNRMTDPLLVEFAQRFISGLHGAIANPQPDARANNPAEAP